MKADICQVDDNDDRGVDEQIVRIKCYQASEVRWPKGKSDGTNDDFEDHCYDADDEKIIGRVAKTRFSHTTMPHQTRSLSLSSSKSSASSSKSSLSSSLKNFSPLIIIIHQVAAALEFSVPSVPSLVSENIGASLHLGGYKVQIIFSSSPV